jgi:outer membrane protein TolC
MKGKKGAMEWWNDGWQGATFDPHNSSIPLFHCSIISLGLLCWGGLLVLAGCGPKNYKADADRRVYDIIERKWEPRFGTPANYRIRDVAPGPNDVQIDSAIPASGIVTLPCALALATAHNRDYQTQKELLYTAALDLRLVRHGYETQLFGGGSALYLKDGEDAAVQTEANLGFNRLLATGTQISTRIAIAWAEVLAGTGHQGWNSIFSAVITQPLLRGSDRRVVMENLTLAERTALYQIRTFNRFRKTFAVAVATQYLQALELYDVAQNTRAHLNALTELETRSRKVVAAGLIPGLEIDQIRQDVLKARDALVLAQKEYERSLDQLKLTLALPMTSDFQLDPALLDVLRQHGIPRPEIALNEAIEGALCTRLDVTNSADAVLDAQRAVYVAADSLRADLRLAGRVDVNARGDQAVAAGPILDLPLDRVPEQHAYRKALIALETRRREYDLLADTVRLQVREAHRKLTETAERYEILSAALTTAQARDKRASVLMQYGQASSRRVLDALDDLYDARNAATDALIDYAVATLDFYRDTESLQVRPDGMWREGPDLPVSSMKTMANIPAAAK